MNLLTLEQIFNIEKNKNDLIRRC